MAVYGQPVQSVQIKSALNKFATWLKKFPNVIPVTHNGRRFNFPVPMSAFLKIRDINLLLSAVPGFIHSLSVFRKKYPKRSSYKQENLAKDILNTTYNAHNAIGDVESLGQLIGRTNMSAADLLAYSFPPQATYNSMLFNRGKSKNFLTFWLPRVFVNGQQQRT